MAKNMLMPASMCGACGRTVSYETGFAARGDLVLCQGCRNHDTASARKLAKRESGQAVRRLKFCTGVMVVMCLATLLMIVATQHAAFVVVEIFNVIVLGLVLFSWIWHSARLKALG